MNEKEKSEELMTLFNGNVDHAIKCCKVILEECMPVLEPLYNSVLEQLNKK